MKEEAIQKQYIGDGAYAEFDGYSFILSAERFDLNVPGKTVTHFVALEPAVLEEFLTFVKRTKAIVAKRGQAE